jgi:hypothetical protein
MRCSGQPRCSFCDAKMWAGINRSLSSTEVTTHYKSARRRHGEVCTTYFIGSRMKDSLRMRFCHLTLAARWKYSVVQLSRPAARCLTSSSRIVSCALLSPGIPTIGCFSRVWCDAGSWTCSGVDSCDVFVDAHPSQYKQDKVLPNWAHGFAPLY